MSLSRALAWNTAVQLAGKVVSTALGIVIIGLMTRLLGQVGFGYYSTANAYLQVFVILLDLGLNVTLVAMLGERSGDEKFERRCVSALFTLRLILALILIVLIAPAIAWYLPYPLELKLAVIALTGSFFFPALNQVVTGVQQRHLQMHFAALGEVLGRLVLLVGLLIAREQGWGLLPIVWFVTLGSLGNFILCYFATHRIGAFHWNWDPAFWRMALTRSWPIGVSIMFNLIYYKADTLILSWYRPQAEVGVYGAAYRVLEILITLPYMYIGVLLPILSKAWMNREREKFAGYIGRSFDVMMLLVIPIVVGIWLLGPDIMTTVAGPEFALSGEILKILAIAIGVIYINVVFAHAIVAVDAQKKMLPIYIVVALCTLAGYVAFIPSYGMWAAAWLTVLAELAVGLGSLTMTLNASRIDFKLKATAVAVVASAFMALIVWLLRSNALYITIPMGGVAYLAAVYALGGIPKSLIKEMLSFRKTNVTIEPPV